MLTCLYYLPPSQFCSSTELKQQPVGWADSRRYLEFWRTWMFTYIHACWEILQLTRIFMRSPLLCYSTYLSCCFQLTWLGWQRISPVCWTPPAGLAFHPIPELSLAPWKKLSRDGLPSLCFPALVVVQCCDFWSSAHLVVLQNTQMHISLSSVC